MPDKPTVVPVLDSNETNRVAPASAKQTDGFSLNDLLPASNFNYLVGWAADWCDWLDQTFGDGATPGELNIIAGELGINTSTPARRLHVFDGSSGGATSNSSTVQILESDGTAYLSFLTPKAATAGLLFANPTDGSQAAAVSYDNNVSRLSLSAGLTLRLRTAATDRLSIDNLGDITPGATGQDFGSDTLRWGDIYGQYLDIVRGSAPGASITRDTGAGSAGVATALVLQAATTSGTVSAGYGSKLVMRTDINGATRDFATFQGVADAGGTFPDGRAEFLIRSQTQSDSLVALTLDIGGTTNHGDLDLEPDVEAVDTGTAPEDLSQRAIVVQARNDGATTINANEPVILKTGAAGTELEVERSTTADNKLVIGVALEQISAAGTGRIAIGGIVAVKCATGVDDAGHLLVTDINGLVQEKTAPAVGECIGKSLSAEGDPVTGQCWALIAHM